MTARHDTSAQERYLQGLKIAASGNAQAFGYSILITVSYGIASTSRPPPVMGELFAFAMSAVAAFSLLNVVVAWFAGRESGALRSKRALLVATATDFFAVGAGLAAAFGISLTCSGFAAWVLIPFVAGLTYMLVQAIELGLARMDEDPS